MNKKSKLFSIFLFAIMIVSVNTTLMSADKEYVKCVTCGHKMLKSDSVKVEHNGNAYYVCGSKCKAAFEKNPDKFVHRHKTVYKCTTEACSFTSDKPGKCPHCKTDLKKVEVEYRYKCTSPGCKYSSDKPGKCPHCKTELKKIEVEVKK